MSDLEPAFAVSLRGALILLVLLVLGAGLVPAGIVLQARLETALVDRARDDLASAPIVLEGRIAAARQVRMMHAEEISATPALVAALAESDIDGARRTVTAAARAVEEIPVLVDRSGDLLEGPVGVPQEFIDATRRGEMRTAVVAVAGGLHLMGLAPVSSGSEWVGAAGSTIPFGDAEAGTLSGLTQSGVLIMNSLGQLVGASMDADEAARIALALPRSGMGDSSSGTRDSVVVRTIAGAAGTFLTTESPVDEGRVVFVRNVSDELSLVPALRRIAGAAAGVALLVSLVAGIAVAALLSRPVAELAVAAQGFAAGKPDAPLQPSRIKEVRRLSDAFVTMRASLASRLTELHDRQVRLSALQAELVQRERTAATGRLIAQLAHEIRNPIASVRNCLELVRRKGRLEGEAREFADMAVDELLRMHELSERMLDLHRPGDPSEQGCVAAVVAREAAQLSRAGAPDGSGPVSVVADEDAVAAIGPDALKQVLLNLVINAREASNEDGPVEVVVTRVPGELEGRVRIEVLDRGPGLSATALPRLFDPFFTTKSDVRGVGLGLYTAEVIIRAAGGTLSASNRDDGPGASFMIDLPAGGRI